MKRMCVIAAPNDRQASSWLVIAQQIGADTYFFNVEQMNNTWAVDATDSFQGIIDSHGSFFAFTKDCWYFRGPILGESNIIAQLQFIHACLSLQAYPQGNYFCPPSIEADLLSKPKQHSFFGVPFPASIIKSAEQTAELSENLVLKSLSHIRSVVTTLGHVLSQNGPMYDSCGPVLLQNMISGFPVKVHCYVDRTYKKLLFSCVAESEAIDYRYAASSYSEFQGHHDLPKFAKLIFEKTQSRFFDFDIIVDGDNSLVLLEVNFSPAPCFFEQQINKEPWFSKSIIKDWLS